MSTPRQPLLLPILFCAVQIAACLTPPARPADTVASLRVAAPAPEKMAELDAWTAVALMSPGINIGNTLENTTSWETGWGNPPITKEFVESLARLGFKTVRVPVAWDTYADDGRIQSDKLSRVSEVVDWITGAGMFCVVNIHWDGGWIDSGSKDKFPDTYATLSPEAEKKFRSYWEQISSYFAGKNEKLIFEALNEETNFANAGSVQKAYATLTRVNQLFIDTVRKTGGAAKSAFPADRLIGYRKNDAYAMYKDLGSPEQLTRAQVEQIRAASSGKPIEQRTVTVRADGTFDRELPLRENDVFLLVLHK